MPSPAMGRPLTSRRPYTCTSTPGSGLGSLTQAVTKIGATVGAGVNVGARVAVGRGITVGGGNAGVRVAAAGSEITVDEGTTGARVDVGVAGKRVGVTGTINAVGEGVGVSAGVEVAAGDGAAIGVESGDTKRVAVGSTANSLDVAVTRGLEKRVGVADRPTEAVAVGFGPGGLAHAESITPSRIRIAGRRICGFMRPACIGSTPCPSARAALLQRPPAIPSPAE